MIASLEQLGQECSIDREHVVSALQAIVKEFKLLIDVIDSLEKRVQMLEWMAKMQCTRKEQK